MNDEYQDDFWHRTSQKGDLEAARRYERERNALGWRRNFLGIAMLALSLCVLWYVSWR